MTLPLSAEFLHQKIDDTYRRIRETERPEVWIHLRPQAHVINDAHTVAHRLIAGENLPLAGVTVAVKDNIDVAGIPTTAAAPHPIRTPHTHATVVSLLENAGAIIIGKTNMDQFATGLVGYRSPYGAVRAAWSPEHVSGGSSSGSAVAVALGLVDIALGTDTAGSGRIPAAFNNIIGVKPTLGLVSNTGVFPASPSYDTVTVFARTLTEAENAMRIIAAPDPEDPTSRPWPCDAPLSAPRSVRLGVPRDENLSTMTPAWRAAWESTIAALPTDTWAITRIDMSFLLDAAKLLYGGALVAERSYAFGSQLANLGDTADPSVRTVVEPGSHALATALVADQQKLREYRRQAGALWQHVDVIATPTAPGHPSIDEVAAEPLTKNAWLGTFTNFVNLLDLAGIAVPLTQPQHTPAGLTFIGPSFSDIRLMQCARQFTGEKERSIDQPLWLTPHHLLAVFGAHLSGQVLNHELVDAGGVLIRSIETEERYGFYELATDPPKPGLARLESGGTSITGELWALPPVSFASFIDKLRSPMTIGKITLSDGVVVSGFLCEPHALHNGRDITQYGSWINFSNVSKR
jgi:allophanate hydrolase